MVSVSVHRALTRYELVGAPDWVPRMVLVDPSQLLKGRLKIRFEAGRGHFVYDCRVRPGAAPRTLSVLCGRASVIDGTG